MNRNSEQYQQLIENLPDAFAYHQIVTGDDGKPVDYIFLEINTAFEKMTGLTRSEVIGRRVTDVIPDIKKSNFDWIGIYGQVALNGKAVRFESFSEPIGRWYDVSAYSDTRGYFAVLFRDVTKRKQTEESLMGEKLEKELIINNLAEQIAFVDQEMCIIWANSQVIERHNLTEVEYIGQKCYEAYHQLNEPCTDCPVVEALKTGETCSGIHNSPDNKFFQVTGIPIRDQQGEIIGVMNTALEITELISSQQALQDSYSLLRIAGETARFGGWKVNLETNRVSWSDQVALIHGMPIGYSPTLSEAINFYAPEWRNKIIEVFNACTENGLPYDEEMEIITAKGHRVWVRAVGEAVKDEQGNIIGVQGSFQDISEQKEVEAALLESEERLDLAMAVKNEGLWDWNLVTNGTFFDDRYYTMAGYQPGEFPQDSAGWTEKVHAEDLPLAQRAIDDYLNDKSDRFDIEFRFKKKDGLWMWINGKGKIFARDADGKPVRFVGTHTDITERKQAEEDLKLQARERAAVDTFTYSVSNDLQAPLRRIEGFSEALLEECPEQLNERSRAHLKRISNQVSSMKALTDALLQLSRVVSIQIEREAVNLSALTRAHLRDMQYKEPGRQVEWVIAEELVAEGDADLLNILLSNLLDNAWKFTSGIEKAYIELDAFDMDGRTVFYLKDNGTGFNMNHAEKLFAPFQKLHNENEYPGIGIGLNLAYRIISRHKGEIWADSKPDKGACFYYTLS